MNFESNYEICRTISFIKSRGFNRVALQFPDELLKDSPRVAKALRSELGKGVRIYVMADTAYGSCCVDEVGASHVDAQCVVHYGHACMSSTSTLPAMFVFGKASIDIKACATSLHHCLSSTNKPLLVLYGLEYEHALEELKATVTELSQQTDSLPVVHYAEISGFVINPSGDCTIEKGQTKSQDNSIENSGFHIDGNKNNICHPNDAIIKETSVHYSLGGLKWNISSGGRIEDYLLYWIGPENSAFTNVVITFNTCEIVRYDADKSCLLKDFTHQNRILRRRYYLVEKAKDANIVGILVGTLGVAGYLGIVQQMKELIESAGKKSYTFVMGRPNSAKLANFPECDVFVYVSCAQTALLDSKEFLAPVITPFEALLAFSRGRQWTGAYMMDFQDLMAYARSEIFNPTDEARFSFIKGGYVEDLHSQENGEQEEISLALAEATQKALDLQNQQNQSLMFKGIARSGTEFFATRSYQGLDMQYENPAPESYVIGKSGRAAGYVSEKQQTEDW